MIWLRSRRTNAVYRTLIPSIETILEGFDEDDKQNSDAINQDGDAFVAAELKKAVKAIGKNPASDFERGLVQAQSCSMSQRN